MLRPAISEEAFFEQIRELAQRTHWKLYHTYDSRRSYGGFFDVVAGKAGHPLVLAELKTEKGKLTPDQMEWQEIVRQSTGLQQYLWRPAQLQAIADIMSG